MESNSEAVDKAFMESERRAARAGFELLKFLGKNAGTTEDWPVRIIVDDLIVVNELCKLLNELEATTSRAGYMYPHPRMPNLIVGTPSAK